MPSGIHAVGRAKIALVALLTFTASSCAQNGSGPAGPSFAPLINQPNTPLSSSAIQHVIIVVQENRSFDNLFNGFPGANTATSGVASDGTTIPLAQVNLENPQDVCHFHASFEAAYDGGKLDGFDKEQTCGITNGAYGPTGRSTFMYAYVNPAQTKAYWQMATQYALADNMFQSNNGPSFPAHQFLIAGQSDNAAAVPSGSPWGCDAPPGTTVDILNSSGTEVPGPFPCFDYPTLGDLLDAKNLDWRYYSPALNTQSGAQFSAFDAIRHIRYDADWAKDVSPETQFLTDVQNGQLGTVTWIIPSFPNSDHPLSGSNTGPDWVASIVNAVGQSKYWNSTAILVTWDDWGGWYDHVKPTETSFTDSGFRVPLIVISPYAKHGYVSHVSHRFGSILKFIEDDFTLGSLGQEDAQSDNLQDCFDFTQNPAPYTVLQTRRSIQDFIRAAPVPGPNDPD